MAHLDIMKITSLPAHWKKPTAVMILKDLPQTHKRVFVDSFGSIKTAVTR
jgi:hypothetical protein